MATLCKDVPMNRPVTPSKKRNPQVPPGGSNFAGHYQKKAFAAYTFPKDGAKRLDMRDFEQARGAKVPGQDLLYQVAVHYHCVKEEQQPSRLRANFLHAKANPPQQAAWEVRAQEMMKASASSPAIGVKAHAPEPAREPTAQTGSMSGSMGATGMSGMGGSVDREVTAGMLNPTHCPHPSLTRGQMTLSKGRARDWGINLDEAPGYQCPFFEAPKDRLALRKEVPETEPRTLEKSLRWSVEDVWSNPDHHATYKVGEVDGTGPMPGNTIRGATLRRSRSTVAGDKPAEKSNATGSLLAGYGKSEQTGE